MTDRASAGAPVAFISSTSEDLGPFRQKARDVALVAGFFPRMMEYFATGGNPPLEEFLRRISEDPPARLLIVLVAHRYGWVPEDQPEGEHRSITWLECLESVERDLEILAFVIDEDADWPEELKEENRIAAAVREGKATPELLMGVQKNVEKLREFKSWLGQGRVRASFSTPQEGAQ